MDNKRGQILGIPVDLVDIPKALNQIKTSIEHKKNLQVVTVNAEMIMLSREDEEFKDILNKSGLVIPDGSGVIWALRRKGTKINKLPGIELAENCIKHLDTKIFLLGAQEETISKAYENLKKISSKNNIIGYRNGFFNEQTEDEVIKQINDSGAELVLVGLGVPKQEKWVLKNRDKLNATVFMGVGGSFDVFAGKISRAPKLMIKLHLEWLYRLYKEPWRWRRMLALPKFVGIVLKEDKV